MQEVISYLDKVIKEDDKIVAAISGGPDSMCLLDILIKINKKIKIVVAHINHNIREESEQEAQFIKDYCQEKKVLLETTKFSKKSKRISTEMR